LAQNLNRFDLVRKGYDTQAVDQQLRQLNAELVRLSEQNAELQTQLRNTRVQLVESEAALANAKNPNFASLGAKAATILSSAQQISAELELDAASHAERIATEAKQEADRLTQESESNYQSVVDDAKRRASRKIAAAELEAKQIRAEAMAQAESTRKEAELEAARTRGMVATEVASLRSTAKRELAQKETELLARHQAKLNLLLAENLTGSELLKEKEQAQLEAVLAERRAEAEAEYLAKHLEAVSATEQYLDSAKRDLIELSQAAANLRLEIETLELEASLTQRRILQEARDTADAVIRSAEVEARNLIFQAKENVIANEHSATQKLSNLQNQVASIETYLENLRSLVIDGFPIKDADGTKD
jgi:cell division septum initiation protein DivIVA